MRALPLLLLSAAALASCAQTTADGVIPVTPLSRYSLQVEPGVDRIALAVHDTGLSNNQYSALQALAGRYAGSGAGWVRVEAPAGDDPVATRHAYATRDALAAAGVPGERIQIVAYAAPDPRAPVLAGFETLNAVIPNCAAQPRAMGARWSNQPTHNLGCAINANIAAQIANPRDILGARAMTPPDSGRAAVVFDNYRKGELTAAPQEKLVEGFISRAVD